jgi:hypothetical protein
MEFKSDEFYQYPNTLYQKTIHIRRGKHLTTFMPTQRWLRRNEASSCKLSTRKGMKHERLDDMLASIEIARITADNGCHVSSEEISHFLRVNRSDSGKWRRVD